MSIQLQGELDLDFAKADAKLENFKRKLSSKDFSQPLGRISGDAAEFRKSLEAATARVTAFGLTAGAIYKVSEAIRAGARATIEVDKQLVELNTFLGQSKNQLEDFSRSLFKVARNAAVPFEAASEAAKEFARQGLSTNEVLKRTEDALTLARISGINYGDAVNGITTAINSFNKEALSSTDIINKLIAVDTRFAVSSAQLNEALTRVGSSAEESGISIDKLIATVTAAQQITGRGGAVIGNALKTIFTRLQRPEVITQLQQLGVSVKDQNGFLLDGISILKNYADATKNLSQIEKSRTAELIGGIYQINQVNALIKDLSSSNSVYANALRISTTATDEAKKKNEELNKSMSALLQNTKNQAQEAAAVLGKSMLEPMVRIGSEFTKMALKFVNPESDLLGSAEKGGESLGSSFAKGVASALGKTLATGGIPLAVGVGGTLLAKMAKFGVSSVRNISKDYQSIFSEKTLVAQERINDLLRQNPSLITSVQNKTMTLAQVEQKLLDLIKLQNRELAIQASIRARVVPTVVSKGGPGKIRAGGYIPNFAMSAEQEEVATAKAYGAKNPVPRVIQATIRGKTGPVVVNNQEKVIPNFAGTRETAIIPNYRKLDEIPRMAKGYVPNFAREKITAAAYKTKKGNIFTGSYHAEAYEKIPQDENNDILDGFVTNSGKFVDRKEAGLIAQAAMQMYHNANTIKYFRSNNYKLDTAFLPMPRDSSFSSGYVPNFAFSSMKSLASEDRKFVDPETYSYLRYKLSNDKKAIDLKFSKSEMKGQGWQMFERLGKTARRMGLPVRSSNLSSQTNNVLDIKDASLARAGKYGIEEVLKVGYPQLIHRQMGSSKNTTLSLNIDDGLGHKNKELSGKDIFSVVSDFASIKYKGDAKLFRNSIIDGSFDISNVETNFAGGRIPNFAKRKDVIQRIGKKEIFARFQKHFEAGKDYQGFYNIHGEEFNNRKLTAQEAKIYANITSAISPSVPDYVAAQFAAPIFNRFMQTRSTNVEDYFDLAPSKIVSRHKNVFGLGLFGVKGTLSKKGNIRTRDDVRRSGLSKALRGVDLGSDDTAKTRHYARAILQDKTAFPIDTNVIQAILGGKTPSKTEAAKLISLANEFATLNKIESGAAGLQAAIFKSNSKHTEKYSPDTVRSALSGIQGRSSGYVPNFAKILIAAKYYDALKVGKAKGVSISKTGDVQNVGREVFGGIGFSTSRIGKGYASAVRSTSPTTSLKKASEQAGVTKSIIIPVVASSAVNDPVPENLKTNEALLQQFLANHPQPKEVVASLSQQGFNVKSILNSHSGSEIKSIIDILSSDLFNKKILDKSADELKDPRLVKFFAPGGVKARGPKGTYAFGSSIASMQQGEYASKIPGKHKSYPILVTGKSGPEISKPINAEEIFPGITNNKDRLFFSSVYQFGTRILDTDNPEHMELLGRLGYSQQRLQQENLMAGGYIPNFSGLSDSISREKTMTGLPASQIMAHFDKSGNPIAVTNKKDEPNGLKDVVPNFAAPRVNFSALSKSVKNLFGKLKGSSPAGAPADAGAVTPSSGVNPISGSFELFAAQAIQSAFDELAEREVISANTAKFAGYAIPAAVGGKNIYRALTDKSMSTGQKVLTGLTGAAQAGGGAFLASKTSGDLDQRIQNKKLSEEIDNAKRNFQNLTENTSELATTLSKLDAAYKDPKADPREITKLVKSREDIIKKITIKNPELVSKLAGQESLTGKIDLLEENQKEQQRILSLKESASAFRSKGQISGADAPGQLAAFFEEAINRGGSDLLKQDFNNATPANFAEILKKGGLDIKEFSSVFNSDDLKKSFISSLKLAQELQAISAKQDQDLRERNRPLAEAKQRVGDAREIRAKIKESLEQQLPELASFAGNFSKRAGISASAEASLAIKKSDAAVAFQNSLLGQLNDKEFLRGLPPEVERALRSIEAPGESTARELQKLEKLPGLGAEQVRGIQRLIDFNSVQTRDLTKSTIIAEESKKIQLKFLALQEKAAFGGDIRTSINPQMRADAMNAGIRGPLTYQLGGLIGSRRSQVAGATDFITDTLQRYPGLLQTKDGKEPRDIQAVKGELTQLNALDMQKDLLKRAGMAQMMGLGQTASLLQGKAFDPKYLLESAGLKANALFESPDVPKEVRDAMKGYEQFNVNSVRAGREEDKFLRREEERGAPIKEKIVEESAKQAKVLAEKFEAALKATFGANGVTTTSMNVTATGDVKFGQAKAGEGTGVPSSANGLTKYSNSIADAVKREKTALASRGIMGVPNFAMADINLERSPDLVSASNPHGFGVTNSIDEKNGLRSLGMRSSGYVPNYALFGDKVASTGLSAAKAGNLFVYDHDAQGFYRVTASGRVGSEFIDKNSLPKGAKTISTQPYSTKYESGQSRGSNLLKITDPRLSKLDELNLSSIPRSKRLDPILNKLSKSGKLTPENLLSAINKISGGEPTLVKTAFGSSFAQGKGVFGRSGGVGLDDADEIIKRFQSGDAKGFFAQAKVDGPHYGEMRVHVAVDSNGRVKLLKGGSLLKIGANASDITSKEGVAALAKAGLSKEASKVAREYKKAAESTAVKSIRELVAKKGIKNAFFGVDVGATTLESAQRAGVNSKEFYSGGRGRVGTVVFELNPSEAAGSSGYVRGGISQKLVDQTLGKQLGVMPPGFAPKGSSITKKIADAFTASAASQIAQQSPSYSYMPGANQVASASTSSGSSSYSYMPKQLNRIPEGFKFKSQEAINKILGQELSKSKPLSMGGYGPAIGSQGSVSGGVTNSISEKYGPKAFKFLSKYGGKALGALGGATSIYGYYEGFQEAKRDKYAGAAKMFESTGGLALAGAGLAGAGLATTLALPLAVGALGYGAIKGVEATGLLDAMYGAGYNTVGLGAIGSKSIRGMTSKTAFNDDMIVARKKEFLKEINRYNSVAGNPLVSSEFQLSRSRDAQGRKDEQDLQQLKDRLDKESESARAGIASRAAGAGAAETARLNAQSASEEAARSSSLRKTFLESFDKNAESAGYLTTQDKANYLLSQEGKNGLGSFRPTDFKDAEFARSFNNYKAASEAEAAREANRVIPKSAIEFRNRPMPSFPQDVLEEATKTGRSAERVIQDREEINIRRGATSQGMAMPEINAQMSRDYTSATGAPDFPKDVLEEATRRRVTAEQVMQERAGGRVPNFAAMSNSMMSSGDVYSRMRSSASRNIAPSYAQGAVPNFAAAGFTDAITEALKTGITSAFPNGGSSSNVSNSNVINIDGRTSIQNAPDEAMQGIIGILFDKIPELKKLGPAALNFKR